MQTKNRKFWESIQRFLMLMHVIFDANACSFLIFFIFDTRAYLATHCLS